MSEKQGFFNNNYFGLAIKNIFIAGLITVLFIVGTLVFIHFYTRHGSMRTVPSLQGKSINEAIDLLKENDLTVKIIDSIYSREYELGTVVEQNPSPNSIVKPKRIVYLITNSSSVKKIAIPNIVDMSSRQAKALLKSLGFEVEKTEYGQSAYRDLVIGVKYQRKDIEIGEKIPDQSKLTLVIGNGLLASENGFPYVVGLDYVSAEQIISSSEYPLGKVTFDEQPLGNKEKFIVYKQDPDVLDSISIEKPTINIWLKKDSYNIENHSIGGGGYETDSKGSFKENKKKKQKVKDVEDFF